MWPMGATLVKRRHAALVVYGWAVKRLTTKRRVCASWLTFGSGFGLPCIPPVLAILGAVKHRHLALSRSRVGNLAFYVGIQRTILLQGLVQIKTYNYRRLPDVPSRLILTRRWIQVGTHRYAPLMSSVSSILLKHLRLAPTLLGSKVETEDRHIRTC